MEVQVTVVGKMGGVRVIVGKMGEVPVLAIALEEVEEVEGQEVWVPRTERETKLRSRFQLSCVV